MAECIKCGAPAVDGSNRCFRHPPTGGESERSSPTSVAEDVHLSLNHLEIAMGANVRGLEGSVMKQIALIEQSAAAPELKQALINLTEQVVGLMESMPADPAHLVLKDLDALTTEATSPRPRLKWFELGAAGVIEAANATEWHPRVRSCLAEVSKLVGAKRDPGRSLDQG